MNGPARSGSANWKWWALGFGLVAAVPLFCCCGLFMLGALSPASSPSRPAPSPTPPTTGPTILAEPRGGSIAPGAEQLPEPSVDNEAPVVDADPTVEAPAPVPTEGPAEVELAEGLPGIGATRAHWEATHQRAPGFAPGMAFGPMVRSETGRGFNPTYAAVVGDDRIETYSVQLPSPGLTFDLARARAARERPPDAREVRTRRLGECRMIRYRSATLRRLFPHERHRGDVEVAFFSASPEIFDPRRVTLLTVTFYFGEDIRC